jgi:hypothetical protein
MNSTAPVHEFRCLYTYDIRRKQKRWQDGFLKYHTFNKRAMVYDMLHNFIGDTHWQASGGVGEGDEVELEAGVVVQVGEQVGLSETDLRPIFERPRKHGGESEERRGDAGVVGAEASSAVQRPREILRHKSLNALLGPPKGTLGKAALPANSPFELNNGIAGEEGRAAKRQRIDAQATWTVTRVTTPMRATMGKETPLRARRADARTKRASTTKPPKKTAPRIAGQMSLTVKEVIDITSENDDNSPSDITLQDTLQPKRTPAVPRSRRRNSPPPTDLSPEPMSPPVSTRNKIINVDADTPPGTVDITDVNRRTDRRPSPQSNPRLKPIKLAKSNPRNMLLCEKNNPKFLKTKSTSSNDPRPLDGVDNGQQVVKPSERAKQRQTSGHERHDKSTRISKSGRQQIRPVVESTRDNETSSLAFSTISTEKPTANFTPGARTEERMEPLNDLMDQQLPPVRELPKRATGRATVRVAIATKSSETRVFCRIQSDNDTAVSFPTESFSRQPAVNEELPTPALEGLPADQHTVKKPMRQNAGGTDGWRKKAGSTVQTSAALSEQPEANRKDQEKGPWTIEALDFFDWRPPDWDARVKQKALELESRA